MNRKIILCDLDGTLCNCDHRRHFAQVNPPNWDAFNAAHFADKAHRDIVWLIQLMNNDDAMVIIVSARSDEFKASTIEWLEKEGITYEDIFMRKEKDTRADTIVKKEILDEIRKKYGEPYMAIDDRSSVISMWRENGVRAIQVAPGDF
jgi:phosphoglycolate phosphatase-like HAD superfamily hydrolase